MTKPQNLLSSIVLLLISVLLLSCSEKSTDSRLSSNPDPDIPPNTSTAPCAYNLSMVAANETVTLDCVLDLQGDTVNLPGNVTLDFNKGDVVNGTLIFSSGGKIAGELLSSDIALEGDVELINPRFNFYASRWNIVEGNVTSDIAYKNNHNLEALFLTIKNLGATHFLIDKLDAYFEVTKLTPPDNVFRPSSEAINIPSNFTVEMTENTYLRVFPATAESKSGAILAFLDVENSSLVGGNLIGDRDIRAYPPGDAGHIGSHLVVVRSGRNVTIDGVNFVDGSAGGITLNSIGFSFEPEKYIPTTNVTIKNSTFTNIRRMSISITDAREVYIENNSFTDIGQESVNSDGGEVGYAINIEAVRKRDENGNLLEYQRAFDIFIKENIETNSRIGFVTVHVGQHAVIENNTIGTRVSFSLTNNTQVINNNFVAQGVGLESWAIFAAGRGDTVYTNEIAGNIISGYSTGIVVSSIDSYVHDNTIKNTDVGILLSDANDSRVIGNTIQANDKGLAATNTYVNNAEVRGNQVSTDKANGFHVFFVNVNQAEESTQNYRFTVEDNTFVNTRSVTVSKVNGLTFSNNTVNGGIAVGNSNDIVVSNNPAIKPDESDGIRIFGTNSNVTISDNLVSEPTGNSRFRCVNNEADNPSSVTLIGNTCK